MGLFKSPKAPAAPDPAATAAAQAAANKEAVFESARVNQINEITPFGSSTFTGEIGSPDRTRTIALTPEGQQQLDLQNLLGTQLGQLGLERAGQISRNPFSFEGLPAAPQADDAARQRIEAALFGRLEPQFQRDEDALRTRLANQGITQGSEAFGNALDDFNRARNDARLAVTAAGGAEQSRQFGLESAVRDRALQERLTERALPQNELAALLQGSPAIQTPNFGQTAQFGVAPADVLGAQALNQQAQLARFNAQSQSQQAALGGLAGLGGAAIQAAPFFLPSDRRLKTDIKRVGHTDDGLPIYTYRYKGEMGPVHMGVMAQELELVNPGAVHEFDGVKHVDYGAL